MKTEPSLPSEFPQGTMVNFEVVMGDGKPRRFFGSVVDAANHAECNVVGYGFTAKVSYEQLTKTLPTKTK